MKSSQRHQGRVLRFHFACHAELPHGTTLRVTSRLEPPYQYVVNDNSTDNDEHSGIFGLGEGGGDQSGGVGFEPEAAVGPSAARTQNRLLQNTVEMYTTPETYPIWRTRKPVVVVDDGGIKESAQAVTNAQNGTAARDDTEHFSPGRTSLLSSGPLIHRYRYVAVTPGAMIDLSVFAKASKDHDDDGSFSVGRENHTAATTPPGSDDEREESDEAHIGYAQAATSEGQDVTASGGSQPKHNQESVLHLEKDDLKEYTFSIPPILYENPTSRQPALPAKSIAPPPSDRSSQDPSGKASGINEPNPGLTSAVSLSSYAASEVTTDRTAQMLTWEGVNTLPYRTRRVYQKDIRNDEEEDDAQVQIDHWNDGSDPSFQDYLESCESGKAKEGTETMNQYSVNPATASPSQNADQTSYAEACALNEKEQPLPSSDQRESIFIVCYHLPVILTRDPSDGRWTACWSESLIAKTETHGVSTTRKTRWIGTVSNIPAPFLVDQKDRNAIRQVLEHMDCIPVFFEENYSVGSENSNRDIVELMYLGFCKQVLWPSFHNVDLLDLATNGWGQRQRKMRSDPVAACALAAAEAEERRRSRISDVPSSKVDSEGSMATSITSPHKRDLPQLQSDWDQGRLDSWWRAYIEVNQTFCKVVAELVSGGDIVWVHDYHLALLPRMLREARGEIEVAAAGRKNLFNTASDDEDEDEVDVDNLENRPVRMVFFIHVPFPTSQVFRELEHGEALLEGMLHADIVGFHAFDHARHFLNAAKRILGLTYESLVGGLIGVRHHGTKVLVTVSNVSVETDIIDALLAFPSVREEAQALQRKHEGRSIIAGIAVAQRLSGVSLKLLAFERLLTDYPVWQSKVVLLQRCLIPGTRRVDEADTLREVRSLVQRIKMNFGPEVIDYEEQVGSVLPIDQRLAIWTSSQVVMHTPIREGLNLCPLEYVFSRKEPADPGVVIASEFSALSSILNGALRVNPFDIQMCVTSIDCALSMSLNERDARRGRDIDFVSNSPSGLWTRNVLRDLNDATLESKKDTIGENSPNFIFAREIELGLERLDMRALESAYNITKNRVVIIDFNGTLVVKEPPGKYLKREILGTSGYRPSHKATLALCRLCSDHHNTVYVVSGDSQQNLEVAVGDIPELGLAASNGACFADPVTEVSGGELRDWQYLDFGVDWNSVKKVAMPIISKYTARTNGSFVKLTHSSIGWSYYSCDPEWGSLQASHLVPELENALRSFDVRFVALKGIVEVVPRKLHKGHIVKKVLEDAHKRNRNSDGVDFVLCIGDDVSDEKMFTSVISFTADSESKNSFAFNVAVGKKPTNASFYVDDASDVADVLSALNGEENRLFQATSSEGSCAASSEFFA